MEYYSDEEEPYDSTHESNFRETDQVWFDEEEGYDGSWSDDEYSMSECVDDPDEEYHEPEPPDYSHEDAGPQGECEEETAPKISPYEDDEYSGDETEHDDPEDVQEGSCQEETDSEISMEESSRHEEDFSKTSEAYEDDDGGETFSQSYEGEDGEEYHAKDVPWCEIPYSDQEDENQDEIGSETSVDNSEKAYGENSEYPQHLAEEEEALSEAGRNVDQPST